MSGSGFGPTICGTLSRSAVISPALRTSARVVVAPGEREKDLACWVVGRAGFGSLVPQVADAAMTSWGTKDGSNVVTPRASEKVR